MEIMESLALKCPLCCEETFSSHSSLKYHILSIIDNLLCPACNVRFDNVLDLIEHLDRECKEKELEECETVASESELNILDHSGQLENGVNKGDPDESTLSGDELKQESENGGQYNDMPLSYVCQMCNIEFDSIEQHLQEFHEGEQVILETTEDEWENLVQTKPEPDDYSNEGIYQTQEENDNINNDNEVIEQGEFVDNEGRAFTRKVVKIDKFWVDKSVSSTPMTENYIFDHGIVRKIEEEEETTIQNKDSIIQIHKCPKCLLQFPLLDHFQKHLCDPSKIKNRFKCIYCSAVFESHQELLKHFNSHLVKDSDGTLKRVITLSPHTCEICQTQFPSFKSLRLHQRMHDPVKEVVPESPVKYSISGPKPDDAPVVGEMFVCNICNTTFDKEYEEVHMKSHNSEETFICTICNKRFFTQENLEMHSKAHLILKKFACSYCKKPFTTYDAMEEHVKSQCQQRQYECQYCGRRFSRPHEKVKHERIHTGEKPHICKICGKSFRISYCLTLHMRTHSGTRPYQCKHCGKRFKSHSVYNHHLLTHSNVRAYKCTFCPKAFKTAVQLAGHKNSHIKPFPCTECNRPFASLYAVRSHMQTHKKENNLKYDCFLCGATYARAFALRDHMKEHGNDGVDSEATMDEIVKNVVQTESDTEVKEVMEFEENV